MEYEPGNLRDVDLWHHYREGDRQALALIYDKYVGRLYNYGCKFSKDRDFVKDCIQELFIKLWQTREKIGKTQSVKNYLFKALRSIIFRSLSNQNRHIVPENLLEVYDFSVCFSHEHQIIAEQNNKEQQKSLLKAFGSLTKRQKEAVFLRFYENLSYEEIAEIMALGSVKAARNLVYRSLEVLKKNIVEITIFILSLYIPDFLMNII